MKIFRLTLSMFTCTVKSSCSYSQIRPFNWTAVLVPVYKHGGRIDLRSNCTTVGGNMSRSAGCYWTFFHLAKQTSYHATCKILERWKHGQLNSAVQFIFTVYFCYKFHVRFPSCLQDSCFLPGFLLQLNAVWVPGQRRCRDNGSCT